MSVLRKATKAQSTLRLGFAGPPKSGKTWTSLAVMTELLNVYAANGLNVRNGRIAVIDTEHGSAEKYADIFDFDTVDLRDFSADAYIRLIQEIKRENYFGLIVDSISHEWAGRGGILDQHTKMDAKNSFAAWGKVKTRHTALVETFIECERALHLICTMRAKTKYQQQGGEIKELGVRPIQQKEIKYEFDAFAMMDPSNTIKFDNTRYHTISRREFKPVADDLFASAHEVASLIAESLTSGVVGVVPPAGLISEAEAARLQSLADRIGIPEETVGKFLSRGGFASIGGMTPDAAPQFEAFCARLAERYAETGVPPRPEPTPPPPSLGKRPAPAAATPAPPFEAKPAPAPASEPAPADNQLDSAKELVHKKIKNFFLALGMNESQQLRAIQKRNPTAVTLHDLSPLEVANLHDALETKARTTFPPKEPEPEPADEPEPEAGEDEGDSEETESCDEISDEIVSIVEEIRMPHNAFVVALKKRNPKADSLNDLDLDQLTDLRDSLNRKRDQIHEAHAETLKRKEIPASKAAPATVTPAAGYASATAEATEFFGRSLDEAAEEAAEPEGDADSVPDPESEPAKPEPPKRRGRPKKSEK